MAQEGLLCLWAHSQECGGNKEMGQHSRVAGQSSRRASTGQQNRYVIVCVMKKRRSTKWPPAGYSSFRPYCGKQTLWLCHEVLMSVSGTRDHSPAPPCSFTGFHQRTPELSVQPRNAVLFTDESKFMINNTAEHSLKHHPAWPVWQWVNHCLERYAHWHCSSCKTRYCCSCCWVESSAEVSQEDRLCPAPAKTF